MQKTHKKRIFFIRWLQRWAYHLVAEQEERERWQPKDIKPCIFCGRPIEIDHPFCSQCGGSQSIEAALLTSVKMQAASKEARNTTGAQALVKVLPIERVSTLILPKLPKKLTGPVSLTGQIKSVLHTNPREKHPRMKAYNQLKEKMV